MNLRTRLLIDACLLLAGANLALCIVRRDWWLLAAGVLVAAYWLWESRTRDGAFLQFVRDTDRRMGEIRQAALDLRDHWRRTRETARDHQRNT